MILRLHHSGIRVDSLVDKVKFFEGLGYKVLFEFELEEIGGKAAMLLKDGTGIELFEIIKTDHELAQKVSKHTAFETDNIEEDVQKFLDAGYELAMPIAVGRVMKKFAYLKDKTGNYIELCMPPNNQSRI
jgi:catechol 2,3-dioxygenase-like lactoylglutathione lyase family enzyme